jgi:flagellar hook-length control protein FliK
MADLALLVGNTDAALLNEGAVASVGGADTGRADGFSRLLGEQVQMTRREPASTAGPPLQAGQTNGQTLAETGEVNPPDGKLLPQTELKPGLQPALHSILQDASGELEADLATLPMATQPQLTPDEVVSSVLGQMPGQPLSGLPDASSSPLLSNAGVAKLPHEPVALQGQHAHKALRQNALSTGKPVEALNLDAEKLQNVVSRGAVQVAPLPVGQAISASARLALARAGISETGLRTRPGGEARAPYGLPLDGGWSLQTAAGLRNAAANLPISGQVPVIKAINTGLENTVAPLTPNLSEETNSFGLLAGIQRLGAAPVAGGVPMLNVATTVGQPGWANEIGQRVTWLANSELREAQLQLHPRQLGPIEVRIVLGQEQQMNVSFTATNPATREALDAAMPRLREMLEQQGLNLANSDVSHESFAEQRRRNQADTEAESGAESSMAQAGDDADAMESALLSPRMMVGEGMIDAYA